MMFLFIGTFHSVMYQGACRWTLAAYDPV